MTLQPQPENEIWVLEPEKISPNVNIMTSPSDDVIPDEKFKWFQIILPQTGDTEQEKNEQKQAQLDQLKLGILKIQQPQQKQTIPQLFQRKQNNPNQIDVSRLFEKPKKLGPNDLCHCGSLKKFKKCHGRGL